MCPTIHSLFRAHIFLLLLRPYPLGSSPWPPAECPLRGPNPRLQGTPKQLCTSQVEARGRPSLSAHVYKLNS